MKTSEPRYRWQSMPVASQPEALLEWEKLYAEVGSTPLLHPDFVASATRVFGRSTTRLATCTDRGRLVACAIVDAIDPLRLTTFQPSQAPVGPWIQRRDVSTESLLRSLLGAQPPWVVSFGLTQQDPMILPRPEQTSSLLLTEYIDTARITIDRPWDDYWRARGANLRHNVKRAKAKLTNAGKTLELRVLSAPDDMQGAVRTYGDIESRSWKASEGTAVSFENEQGRFYLQLLESFARREKARCYQLLIDGQVAATDLCVLGADEMVILKTTYDDAFRDYSPAFLMREIAFERLFSEHWCKRIEFYGKVMDWHLRWTDDVRRMYHGTYFRFAGMLKMWQAIKQLRSSARTDQADAQVSRV